MPVLQLFLLQGCLLLLPLSPQHAPYGWANRRIAALPDLTKGNISVVVNTLEKSSLVKRSRGTSDRRQTIIKLTPKGRKLIERVFPKMVAAMVEEFSTLTASELETLGRLLKKLGRADLP